MKDRISLLVQFGPIFPVVWWMGRRHGHQGKMLLRDGGPALAASGLCSLLGAKWFGLSFFGKTTVSHGEDAVDGAIFMMVFGGGVFALHYLVFAFVPALWRLVRPAKDKR